MGDHRAAHDRWTAACADGSRFSPQAWFLPTSHVLLASLLHTREVGALLTTVRVASDGPLPRTPRLLVGRLVAATPGEVRLRVAGHLHGLRLADLTGCIGSTHVAGRLQEPTPVPCSRFAAWARTHRGRSLEVGAYVGAAGVVETLVER